MVLLVPENVRRKAAEYKDIFDKVDSHCKNILARKKKIVTASKRNNVPKIIWKFKTYEQLSIHRVLDFVELCHHAWMLEKPASSFILKRAILENAVLLYDTVIRLKPLLTKDAFYEIDSIAMEILFSNRTDRTSPYQARNILTILDHIEKIFPGIRQIYNYSSEYAHPNRNALLGLYGKIKNGEKCYIDHRNGFTKLNIMLFYKGLETNLSLFMLAIKELDLFLPDLFSLARYYDDLTQRIANLPKSGMFPNKLLKL
ncbi:hypothetical protein JW935_14495 [candidate division KSB1 bacterium]|nr:hypothetical protein [candidate division KSB1 bacterium]